MTTKTRRLIVPTGLTDTQIHHIANALAEPPRAGRPWALPLASRVVLTTAALRTNLTVRHQPAAVFDISKSQAHRIIDDLTPRLADLLDATVDGDRRCSWTVDGTLIPTELHTPTFAGGRIVRDAAWRRHPKRRARAEHCIARLKDPNVLRDHRRLGRHLPDTLRAVAYLHNLRILTARL